MSCCIEMSYFLQCTTLKFIFSSYILIIPVLLKFIQVYPELRDTLWTLDEDGEVSGTVTLMLGSLMMRGALHGAGALSQPPVPMEEAQQPMEQADQPMEQSNTQQEQQQASQQKSEADQQQESEPCDTS